MTHFIIAAGGTGMRMLEAFVHQCAAGIYAGDEFHLLSIDTDSENKNRKDLIALTEWYSKIRGEATAQKEGLFAAKLNSYHFVTKMPQNNTNDFNNVIANIATTDREDNILLSKLLFSEKVRSLNLDHGYRAQTHLGSFHMYASILNSAKKIKNGNSDENDNILKSFVTSLDNSDSNSKILIFGSVFGGTGASSVPILPKALDDAGRLIIGNDFTIIDKKYGCSVLTDYFSFNAPTGEQLNQIIAKSQRFRDNSLLALDYYNSNMSDFYKNIYIVGNYDIETTSYSSKDESTVHTGGASQSNPSHYLELIATASTYSFLNSSNDKTEYYFKTLKVGSTEIINFKTFINIEDNLLEKGFANLLALELIRKTYEGSISKFSEKNTNIGLNQFPTKELDEFLQRFKSFYDGIHNSIKVENIELLNYECIDLQNPGVVFKNNHFEKNLRSKISKNAYLEQVNNDILNASYDLDSTSQYETNSHKLINAFYNTYNTLTKI